MSRLIKNHRNAIAIAIAIAIAPDTNTTPQSPKEFT